LLSNPSCQLPLAHHRGPVSNLQLVFWDFCDRQNGTGAGFSESPVVTLARYCASVSYSYIIRSWYSMHWYQGTQSQCTVAWKLPKIETFSFPITLYYKLFLLYISW